VQLEQSSGTCSMTVGISTLVNQETCTLQLQNFVANLGWVGSPDADKELAEQPYYRHYSRRFMCKKIGHGN